MPRPAPRPRLLLALLLLLQGLAAPAAALHSAAGGWLVELCAPGGEKRVVRIDGEGREVPTAPPAAACLACPAAPLAAPPAPPRLAGAVRWEAAPGWAPPAAVAHPPARPAPPYAGRAPPALA